MGKGKQNFVLFESAAGYGLFEVVSAEEVGAQLEEVQAAVVDLARFSEIVKMKAFQPFKSAADALQNINNVSEGVMDDSLREFLEVNLPKVKKDKKKKFSLGVTAPNMGTAIQEGIGFPCHADETTKEIVRGIRLHFSRYQKGLSDGNLEKAQLGLGHAYSRAKVKFNVNRSDNMIIQAICLLDQMDKDINTFQMRLREWYSWHFPELLKSVADNGMYTQLVKEIGHRHSLKDKMKKVTEITMDEDMTQSIWKASQASMGMDVSDVDMSNILNFANRVVSLQQFRKDMSAYLREKMAAVAPNLGELIGDVVAARLISHAGSLTNLAKCPASTVQILGAEKALFRALKTKGNTPKYGLIFHSSFISRASAKNKGRISRYLANKCAIAARIDSFSEKLTSKYGEKMKEQVEERLRFYSDGVAPRKNIDVMNEVKSELTKEGHYDVVDDGKKKKKSKKKSKKSDDADGEKKKKKKSKKDKKKRKAADAGVDDSGEKKKKKKKKKKA